MPTTPGKPAYCIPDFAPLQSGRIQPVKLLLMVRPQPHPRPWVYMLADLRSRAHQAAVLCLSSSDVLTCKIQGNLILQRRDTRLSMILRTRWINTALVACALLLQPVNSLGQSSSESQEVSAPAPQPSPASSSSSSTPHGATANSPQSQDPQQHPVPTVTLSTGEEDKETEQIIQQELQTSSQQEAGPPRPETNVSLGRDEVLIRGDEQEKNQDIYKARGHVEIRFRTYTLHADEATYDSTTGQVTATGHVVFDGGPNHEHLVGTHATYDVSRDTGTFYDVVGSTGIKVKNQMMFLTSSTPFFFTGKVVDKLGPRPLPGPPWIRDLLSAAQAQVAVQFLQRGSRSRRRSPHAQRHSANPRHSAFLFPLHAAPG